ncbi:BTB/POZ domain-containing protein FBL11 isoform X9 [Durio zibethinus]|uniref:BTB/POZ domain-containing protein FBL11 isoform X9 n=1 Tax=Durio zibethinus TaxID=66656 RepID=A0A6P6AQS4_DURZI|nr:BTB/POZ domain-containing protein FBL11 isoform X9 [Durio zibethinus]
MASSSDDDEFVILVCTDPNNQIGADISNEEIVISTTDISHWDFPSILSFQTFKIQAHRNRLIEESSYFRGLLSGSFSESCSDCISIEWQLETFLNVLRCMFRCPLDITSRNFIPLFEAALYFGVEMLLLQLKSWFSEVSLSKDPGLLKIQLDDLIRIWNFGLEHANGFVQELCASYLARNFMWTMSSNFFEDVPYDLLLLCIKHPHLTVDSEKHLSDALFIWLDSNTKQLEGSSKTENEFSDILKQIRISLLPLWFASGKRSSGCFSELANESVNSIFRLMKVTTTGSINALGDSDLSHLRIRLTEYSKRMDLSGCPQITPMILLLSLLPNTHSFALALRKSIKEAVSNLEQADGSKYQISQGLLPTLSFEAVQEVDISGCLKLHLEVAIECFSKSFPCLRKVKAAYLLNFRTTTLYKLVQKCPLVSEVDITIDMNPLISSQVSVISSTSSSPVIPLAPNRPYIVDHSFSMTYPYHLGPSLANITKLTMEGRSDVCDSDVQYFSKFCVSLCYLNLKGCISLTDVCIANLIRRCTKLHSILVCHTSFGMNSILALCTASRSFSNSLTAKFGKMHLDSLASNLQLLHMGGCKFCSSTAADEASLLELLSQTQMLKSLCLRDTNLVDNALCNFSGSLLEMLDVSNTMVISDCTIINMITSLRQLRTLSLCYCLGDISISSFNLSMPSLRKLRLERVTPWMTNNDLVLLTQNCTKLVELALLGCKLLNSDAQCIISRGWPGLISIHLEDCGELTKKGISSLFNCTALEDLLLRHNGPGVQRNFILDAALKLPMLRQVSLDLCDASEGDFDLPDDEDESDRYSLRSVKIARCKSGRCNAGSHFAEVLAKPAHRETLVLVWNSRNLVRTVVKERL